MAKLLYIESSPRKERAASIEVARHFLDAYRKLHPNDTIETLDLWQANLPPFDQHAIDAKYAILHGEHPTPEQQQAWQAVVNLANHFKSADKYVISLPMWNFGIPYILKHYLDILVQPGLAFSFSPAEGYKGLITGKPALAIYARGGAYGAGTGAEGYDQQTRYLQQVLGFIGFTDVKSILVEPTLAGPDAKNQAVAKAKQEAEPIAKAF
ncbi:MAG: NAD(P)H-dependent oxidoreductase [Verrucomicrobiota bacterium]